jgi:phosphatidylserine/phosphatidylglycerophosphate/cardiolipin synthase-like enzyme
MAQKPTRRKKVEEEEEYVSSRDKQTRLLISVGLILILVAVLAIGAVVVFKVGEPAPIAEQPPATLAPNEEVKPNEDVTKEPIEASTVQGALGSGGKYQTDWYELYFTAPVYPDNPDNHKNSLDLYLTNFINSATRTVDVADYDFDLDNVATAMVNAAKRGVRVRMVTDSDTVNNTKNEPVQKALDKLRKANIPIVEDNRGPIMHNKFTVVDNKAVSTGSWNYTDGDTYHLNNNVIFIKNAQIAQNYTTEFEKMFVKKQFGNNKDKGVPFPSLIIGSAKIENYFAAEDGVAKKITEKVTAAKSSIYFMAFSFTQDDIGKAIRDKAKAGLKVGGVFETTGSNTPYSEFTKMKKENMEVYTDGNPWVMHHKVIIIDDHITIFGSFNFSDNADKSNDENLLIIDDEGIAKAFKTEYDRVLAVAKAKVVVPKK